MGWVSKAAKLGAKALEKAPRAARSAAKSAKYAAENFAHWTSNTHYRRAVGRPEVTIRNLATGVSGGEETRRWLKKAKKLKEESPKMYQSVKDAIAKGGVSKLSKARKALSDQFNWNYFSNRGAGMRTLRQMTSLAKRNLLPAAAAGAGVAASRKPKSQGYAMGGMVKRSKKGC